MTIKPDYVLEEHLRYLDELRESGETNMYGASPYLVQRFNVDKRTARNILSYWMKSFDERHPE
jgi:hypothetical protein